MSPWELAAAVGLLQHMWIATWQAEAVGISRRELSARVRREAWLRYRRGVTGWPGPLTPIRQLAAGLLAYARPTGAADRIDLTAAGDDVDVADAVAAAALNAGQVVTGRSGAWLHGFASKPSTDWFWLPTQSGRVHRGDAELRYGGRMPGAVCWVRGLPVFDPEGCIIETARTSRGSDKERCDELLWMMARADSLRKATLDSVEQRLAEMGQVAGRGHLERAIQRGRGKFSHSRPEHKGRDLVAAALAPFGLVAEPAPYEVWVDGRRIAEADIAVVEIKLDIEVDGPHHGFLDQRMEDDERDRTLRHAGWQVERLPVELTERPKVFQARVHAAVEARLAQLA